MRHGVPPNFEGLWASAYALQWSRVLIWLVKLLGDSARKLDRPTAMRRVNHQKTS